MADLVPCRSCRKPIFFALTEKGHRMPIDPEPRMDGSLIVTEEVDGPTCRAAPLDFSGPRFLSHFATCPQAAQHRKPTPTKRKRP